MDQALYKYAATSRGLNYRYYFAPSINDLPVLLFLHGFPGSSYDWRNLIAYFQPRGYGIMAPDLLGFGKTDRPSDPQMYKSSAICRDMTDLLDVEQVRTAVVMGHDWGAKICSRMANYFPDRCRAFAFIAVGYLPPEFPPHASQIEAFRAQTKAIAGYEFFGYWHLFCSEEGRKLIVERPESFFSMCFTDNPLLALSDFCPPGALQSWLENDKRSPVFLSRDELSQQMELFYEGDVQGPLAWYRVLVESIDADDNKGIPPENAGINKPVFFAGCLLDYICIAALQRATFFKHCTNWIFRDYVAGHWIILEDPDKLNADLLSWLQGMGGNEAEHHTQPETPSRFASLTKTIRSSLSLW